MSASYYYRVVNVYLSRVVCSIQIYSIKLCKHFHFPCVSQMRCQIILKRRWLLTRHIFMDEHGDRPGMEMPIYLDLNALLYNIIKNLIKETI
jgi:hypothetical protein